jgi:hypothetical protein
MNDDPDDPLADLPDDRTTAQDAVDSAVDRKGAAWVRENIGQVLGPLKLVGIDTDREDVTIPADGDTEGDP